MSQRYSLAELVTIDEASVFLREPRNTTRARVYSGKLPSVRLSARSRRIRRADLLKFAGLTLADLAIAS